MYTRMKIRCGCASGILCRFLSSAEISTALRPFYFSVHPDLFGKYPEQRSTNENSLQQLSAFIEAQQSRRRMSIPPLSFYIRQRDMPDGNFKLVKIHLNGNDVRETVVKVLNACDISTSYVDKIPTTPPKTEFSKPDFAKAYQQYTDDFEKATRMKRDIEKKKAIDNIVDWIYENSAIARDKYEATHATRDQVQSLIDHLRNTYGIKEVKYDSGWNISHIRGALQSLVSLATQHSKVMGNLEGRTIALGQFTGVSLDGDVFLNIIDVRNEWLSLIKKVSQEDSALTMIPNYEKALSSILRDIHICRREAGPLMVSPTGQFITPSSCPADELIAFITNNLDEATLLLTEYNINKHVERALCKEVKERFHLLDLHKDDSITPGLMISCCQRLLTRSDQLNVVSSVKFILASSDYLYVIVDIDYIRLNDMV
ncbi:hypothetical protein O3G_MSEX003921 [Manduca sexta]|uniref:T-cell activation inhibitor, mitochondrial n=1 Tax=Manduca sexta TaxID=7130 RepID=A0A922CH58_MANSE|nr:hypothetical protein O3G_MSEX003921 [Manduca sexta]